MLLTQVSTQELAASDEVAMPREPQSRTKITFDEVHERVCNDDKGKWDVVLPSSEIAMQDGKIFFSDCKAYDCESGLQLSNWATGQVCSRLNIPSAYFKRCPEELQDEQFNWWNGQDEKTFDAIDFSSDANIIPDDLQFNNALYTGQEKRERWLLRAKGESLRAVLTDRYTPIDNRMLLQCLHRTLPSRLQVQWISLDEESFHLRLFDPELCVEVSDGDPLMAGLHISNSEVGKRSVTIDAIVYRQVCSNGLIKLVKGKSLMQQRHIAIAPAHFVALLQQAMHQALIASHEFLEQTAWSAQEPIRDVETEMKTLVSDWHLSQVFVEKVEACLLHEERANQENLFGLVNALTRAAQSQDAEQRYDMEVLAGKFLERKLSHSQRPAHLVALPHPAVSAAKVLLGAEEVTA